MAVFLQQRNRDISKRQDTRRFNDDWIKRQQYEQHMDALRRQDEEQRKKDKLFREETESIKQETETIKKEAEAIKLEAEVRLQGAYQELVSAEYSEEKASEILGLK